jgi:hypothetical protein
MEDLKKESGLHGHSDSWYCFFVCLRPQYQGLGEWPSVPIFVMQFPHADSDAQVYVEH